METMSAQMPYIIMLLSISVFHGISLSVLIRNCEGRRRMVAVMAAITIVISFLGGLLLVLLPSPVSTIYITAFMMLVLMGVFYCFLNTGSPLVERLFIYITYVAVFMLLVGLANCLAAMFFPMHAGIAQFLIRTFFSVLLVILLKLFLKDRLYSLVDGLCGQAVEITVFSWMLGLFILAYVIFSLFFISDPVKKFAVLCVLSLVIFSVFMLALRIVRLAEHKIAMERVLGRQRILEGELEAEKDFFEKARAIRHDQRHHDRIVLEYLESGQIGEAKRYLGAKEDALHADRFMSWCGNPLLDAQLRIAWRSCRQKGIDLDIDVQIPKKPLLNDIDFVSVVGNLVENAIEAASKSASPRIYICSNVSDGYLVMEIENTFSSKVEWGKGMLETTKKEGGIGLRSFKRILARHKGVLQQEVSGNNFISRVIMPVEN